MKKWWQNFMHKRLWVTPATNYWQYEHFNKINRELLDNIQYIIANVNDLSQTSVDLNCRIALLESQLEFLKAEAQADRRLAYDNVLATRCKILLDALDGQVIFLNEDGGETEATFNTSIISEKNGFIAAARLSNAAYRNDTKTVYNGVSIHYSDIKIFHLSKELKITDSYIVEDSEFRHKFDEARYGFEDLRLFRWKGRIWATAVAVSPHPSDGLRTTQSLICIEGRRVTECHLLKSPKNRQFEKNWIPVVDEHDRLFFIYNFDPLIILEFDSEEKKLVTVGQWASEPIDDVKIRGATNLISLDKGLYLCIVRLQNFRLEGKLVYIHKWAVLNSKCEIIETSEPFFLMRRGIEFAAGLVEDGTELIVSLGVADRRAALLKFSKQKVFDSLITLRR